MKKVIRKITVDLSRKSQTRVVFATQNDLESRCLSITLTDDGKPYNVHKRLTATVNFQRADGKNGAYIARICDDGTIEYVISPTMLMVAGQTQCSVSLFNDVGNKLTSAPFVLDVVQTLYDEHELSEDARLDYIDEMIARFTTFQNQENDRQAAERDREQNEAAREASESNRKACEKSRDAAENTREQNEQDRIASERARGDAEIARSERMEGWQEKENARASGELDRVWSEIERQNNERIREAAENARRAAESDRNAVYEDMDKALNTILAMQQALIGGDYA